MKSFYYRFKNFAARKCCVTGGDTVLVALSGGSDSVALLHLLMRMGCTCVVMHCNFGLRGSESDGDEAFVRSLCSDLKTDCHVTRFDTCAYAAQKKISIEMAARELRYGWFDRISQQLGINLIATGHHGDDAVETFFLNLLRGTGVRGLAGISPRNGKVFRPLLFASSEEIKNYCHRKGLLYRTDSSNLETKFVRNRIRHQIIPLFRELNPSFFDTMLHNMEYMAEAGMLLDEETERLKNRLLIHAGNSLLIPKAELNSHPRKRSILFELLRDRGFSGTVAGNAADALEGIAGRQFFSETHRLVIDRCNLIVVPRSVHSNSSYIIEEGQCCIIEPLQITAGIIDKADAVLLKNRRIAHLDADRVDFPLTVRRPQAGDRFRPLGMTGFKKLSDFFIDIKLNRIEKEQVWLVASGSEIVWIAGYRIDDRYKVTAATTRVLELKMEDGGVI